MAISVVMPALEMAQDTGKLVSWRKKEGEAVAKGEILLEIETDKAVVEVEALADGTLGGVKAQPGDVIPVGQTIAWLLGPGESVPAGEAPTKAAPSHESGAARPASASSSAGAAPSVKSSAAPAAASAGPVRISPKARRLAKEHGVDIATLRGSGADGEILAADILDAARSAGSPTASAAAPAQSSPAASAGSEEKLSSIARLMAERTTQSWTTVPHFFATRELDATALVHTRGQLSAEIEKSHGVRPTHTDVLVALVARTIAKHPRLNASWHGPTTGGSIRHNADVNIAVAMAVEDGVVTSVIRNAAKIGVGEIAVQRRDLAERARSNRLRPEDIAGATFTISNLGMYHVDSFTAIIVPPQAAILAVSAIKDRVIAVDGKPSVRPVMSMTLSSDHRVVDGVRAAAFLHDLVGLLLEPQQALLIPVV
ncbi:MAG TPA: dihydrolipoamide acetyltransferase family protein [Candidatus Acidoferrales bacterium]|jgi:pyruvate dehydrogenase E2 component (dihydrolipoamide acetyltransferase)|nr:dihydrolipoamide acetyltransferase family protein [Candidatus Acidoferrales bacterium]